MIFRDAKGRFMRRKYYTRWARSAQNLVEGSYFQSYVYMMEECPHNLVWC